MDIRDGQTKKMHRLKKYADFVERKRGIREYNNVIFLIFLLYHHILDFNLM